MIFFLFSFTSFLPTDACVGVRCPFGATCENGQCMCPSVCPTLYEPVCASDDKSYDNDCEMRRKACRDNVELEIVHTGLCDDLDVGVISGSGGELHVIVKSNGI